jgi:hypothetical protein
VISEGFNCQNWEKKSINYKNSIFGFQCVAINIEGWFKIYTSYIIYG